MAAFDYVVVGGGSAGAVVAARLAENPEVSVCLLEAGPSDEGDPRILEIARWAELAGSELVRYYGIEAGIDANAGLQHSRAFVLGGCGSHNQAIAFTAPSADLRRWEELGAAGWGPEGSRPYFDRVLGRVHVEEAPPENECAAAFVAAAVEAGYPQVSFEDPDFAEGVGWLRLNVRDGLRQSSSVAYLHPLADGPPNLTIRTGTTALRLVLDGDRVTGVETTGGLVEARLETVVSCGALESPKLLRAVRDRVPFRTRAARHPAGGGSSRRRREPARPPGGVGRLGRLAAGAARRRPELGVGPLRAHAPLARGPGRDDPLRHDAGTRDLPPARLPDRGARLLDDAERDPSEERGTTWASLGGRVGRTDARLPLLHRAR